MYGSIPNAIEAMPHWRIRGKSCAPGRDEPSEIGVDTCTRSVVDVAPLNSDRFTRPRLTIRFQQGKTE